MEEQRRRRRYAILGGFTALTIAATGVYVSVDTLRSRDEALAREFRVLSQAIDSMQVAGTEFRTIDEAIDAAKTELAQSAGKTASETERETLAREIRQTILALGPHRVARDQLIDTLNSVRLERLVETWWPWEITARTERLENAIGETEVPSASLALGLTDAAEAVTAARSVWEAQETARRAAEEAAARLAAPRRIRSTSTVTDSGGVTAPSSPTAPTDPGSVGPVEPAFSIEDYVSNLAPNSYISWVDHLCDGYYVCGRAWVGGVNTTPVRIELDGLLKDIYANRVGISVLVHEAAHARQWWTYGPDIITANEALTGLVGAPAVEYMADCATIVKLGYSTGTYTRTCTPEQLAAAATIWP
jgi:hypothetical protein